MNILYPLDESDDFVFWGVTRIPDTDTKSLLNQNHQHYFLVSKKTSRHWYKIALEDIRWIALFWCPKTYVRSDTKSLKNKQTKTQKHTRRFAILRCPKKSFGTETKSLEKPSVDLLTCDFLRNLSALIPNPLQNHPLIRSFGVHRNLSALQRTDLLTDQLIDSSVAISRGYIDCTNDNRS